jgi:cobalt-zinc-cadmium efflux system membrane fusion protein
MWAIVIRRILTVALLSGSLHFQAAAHEGHDHGAASPRPAVAAAPRAEASSELFELVAIARGGELTIYVDRFATNEPILGASITLETPQGSVDAKESTEGAYRVATPWVASPGRYDLIVTITYKDESDILPITLEVPASVSGTNPGIISLISPAMAQGIRDRLGSNTSSVVAVVLGGIIAGFLGYVFGRRRRRAAVFFLLAAAGALISDAPAHEGEDHSTPRANAASVRDVAQQLPEGGVFVPKPTQRILAIRTVIAEAASYRRTVELPGRVIPDPNASGFVQAAVSGRLSPPEGGFPRLGARVKKGDVLAYVTPPLQAIDISDMRQKQGELDQQISIVERRVARYETLAPSGAVAKVQLEEARLELQGLRDRRAALEKAQGRREPEALIAPVDGMVAEGTPAAGQIAQTNAVVFHIIDPARLWIEALSYDALGDLSGATARVGSQTLTLSFRGAGFTDRNQSIPIHFAIDTGTSAVRVGQFVTVLAETPEMQKGLAVPRASIVRTSTGQEVVYEHVAAERFEARPVRTEPLDGDRVLISQGLSPGRRVVVQGAELLDHIR